MICLFCKDIRKSLTPGAIRNIFFIIFLLTNFNYPLAGYYYIA